MAGKRKKRARLDTSRRVVAATAKPSRRHSEAKVLQANKSKQQARSATQAKPTIPFEAGDDILLVGEGDFSFALSLLRHHAKRFASLTATTYETREELLTKYPQARRNIQLLERQAPSVDANADANGNGNTHEHAKTELGSDSDTYRSQQSSPSFSPAAAAAAAALDDPSATTSTDKSQRACSPRCKVLYSVDATRLLSNKHLKRQHRHQHLQHHNRRGDDVPSSSSFAPGGGGPYTKIAFNFPHIGGKTRDQNRQVRHNQQLVHGFLTSSQALLAPTGSILVTLFEGEPYSLWNVRDLARSAGLVVKRSFGFDARVYPGYRHARTLGNLSGKVDGGRGGVDLEQEGEVVRQGRGWKGEERSARTFEFGLRSEQQLDGSKRKRRKGHDNDDETTSEDES